MGQSVIKTLFVLLISISTFSQNNMNDVDMVLINLTLNEIENSIEKNKTNKLKQIKNHKDFNKVKSILSKYDTVYLKNRFLKKIDFHFFEKIKNNCFSKIENCRNPIFSEKEKIEFYNLIFNDAEINNYKIQINNIKNRIYINQKKIKSKKVIIYDNKTKLVNSSWFYFAKPLYTINKKYAIITFKKQSKTKLYIFKKVKDCWKIKWKKEDLILNIKM